MRTRLSIPHPMTRPNLTGSIRVLRPVSAMVFNILGDRRFEMNNNMRISCVKFQERLAMEKFTTLFARDSQSTKNVGRGEKSYLKGELGKRIRLRFQNEGR